MVEAYSAGDEPEVSLEDKMIAMVMLVDRVETVFYDWVGKEWMGGDLNLDTALGSSIRIDMPYAIQDQKAPDGEIRSSNMFDGGIAHLTLYGNAGDTFAKVWSFYPTGDITYHDIGAAVEGMPSEHDTMFEMGRLAAQRVLEQTNDGTHDADEREKLATKASFAATLDRLHDLLGAASDEHDLGLQGTTVTKPQYEELLQVIGSAHIGPRPGVIVASNNT